MQGGDLRHLIPHISLRQNVFLARLGCNAIHDVYILMIIFKFDDFPNHKGAEQQKKLES